MDLNEWASKTKTAIFKDLEEGHSPSIGEFDTESLKEARTIGRPQMGATVFRPQSAAFEFVFSGQNATVILPVIVETPERVVFMPVPDWVVESIWQGEIAGSHHFESKAKSLLAQFENLLEPDANMPLFGRKPATRRE